MVQEPLAAAAFPGAEILITGVAQRGFSQAKALGRLSGPKPRNATMLARSASSAVSRAGLCRPAVATRSVISLPPSRVAVRKQAHGTAVQNAAAESPGQWRDWYWICFGGVIVFLLSIPILRGRWKPADARRDEAEHEAMVEAELAKLSA